MKITIKIPHKNNKLPKYASDGIIKGITVSTINKKEINKFKLL